MISGGTIRAVHPYQLARISGVTKIPGFASTPIAPVIRPNLLTSQLQGYGGCPGCKAIALSGYIPPDYGNLRGLGQAFDINNLQVPSVGSGNVSVLQTIGSGSNFLPGIGTIDPGTIGSLGGALKQIESWLGIGAGRNEADIIVPVQNNVTAQLGMITNQILTGMNPGLTALYAFYREVWILAVGFTEFVLQRVFTDRRASGQAMNTMGPYFDGACGYPVPLGTTAYPGQQGCMHWGAGTIGGDGTNGMLGALTRAIQASGGTTPVYQPFQVAANQGIPAATASAGGISTVPGYNPQGIPGLTTLPTTILGIPTATFVLLAAGAIILYQNR